MKKRTYFVVFAMILALTGVISAQAQEQTILTVVVPQFWETLVEDTDALMIGFETEFGVDVQIEYADDGLGAGPTNADAVADYSEDLVGYLELGDVVYAEENWLTPEVTRPGYVVDLMPLINADMNLNPNDFYPAVWQSFQWDGGMWAMPTSADTLFMDYVPESFDEVGIAYPNASWTIDDFANAARELTKYNDDNEVELPGAQVSNSARAALFYAFLGNGYYDGDAFPDTPSFATVDFIYILEVWVELLNDGVLVSGGGFGGVNADIPLSVGSGGQFSFAINPDDENTDTGEGFNFEDDSKERALAPLPNGYAILQTNGFAVSSGTKNPQLAYELVRYLSEQLAIAKADVASEPARINYFTEFDASAGLFTIDIERSDADKALIEDALYNGVPTAELRYSRYVSTAVNLIRGGLDGLSALNQAEIDGVTTFEEMLNLDVNFTVIEPEVLTVADNEIVLTFEMLGFGDSLPNQDEWDRLASDFAAQDPEVGAVSVEQMSPRKLIFGQFECAYYPSTLIVSIDPDKMLALDPLLFSDMNYDINDLPAGVLELVQLNGFTYGIPLTVQPLMLNYNPEMFQQAGVPEPIGGWTISEFMNALELLQFIVEEGDPSFSPQGNTTAAILMLVLAQGGNPIDFSTNPPTLDFTSPESVAAAETVLGWAKDGLIEYGGSGGFGGGDGPGGGFGENPVVPIGATFFGGFGLNEENRLTTYPTGANTPVAFDVGAGYINKDMAYPEACYRWMSYLAQHPYVFTGSMPALIGQLNDPLVIDSIGDEAVAAYQQIADMLNDPSVLSITTGDPFIVTWLSRAFDNYVLHDADLLTELELAEQYTRDYMVCAADLDDDPTLFGLLDLQGCVDEVDSAQSQ